MRVYGRPITIASGRVDIQGPPVYVEAPPIRIAAPQIYLQPPGSHRSPVERDRRAAADPLHRLRRRRPLRPDARAPPASPPEWAARPPK
ncbi:hypothetical protein CSW58_12650 [Caulobacter sp. B11]|uniref:hypothetical protein n=1 Tax=Caulobacter sp. B11 TaxID=2048899 RepID=UPI000C12BCDF|nr:hypothetical protein [Caulobacter sp. B11]PHY12432.1 hypothetical protein CSW58_12650 [Caulobacter sp. B11]